MTWLLSQLFIFLFQIVFIYFLSQKTIKEIFLFLHQFFERKTVFTLIALIFLPGTALHELAHFFAATILMLPVAEVKIFPEFKEKEIKLGKVLYRRADFIRSILVGVAPFFVGLFFFFFLSILKLFPQPNFWLNIIFGYFIFVVSSTMFSSKQDLVDLIYVVPLIIITAGIIYIFDLRIDWLFQNKVFLEKINFFLKTINFYLFVSLLINLAIIFILTSARKLLLKQRS